MGRLRTVAGTSRRAARRRLVHVTAHHAQRPRSAVAMTTAIVGCGLIGRRRAEVAAAHSATGVAGGLDTGEALARALARETGCAWSVDWRRALESGIDIVVVATPNAYLAEIGIAALDAGKHVLIEK